MGFTKMDKEEKANMSKKRNVLTSHMLCKPSIDKKIVKSKRGGFE